MKCLVYFRAPETWKRPDEFDVERWRPDGPAPNELTENFAYLPFGGGRRKCIGQYPLSCYIFPASLQ